MKSKVDSDLSNNFIYFSELVQHAKEEDKKYLEEVLENVLRESGLTNLKNEDLKNSLIEASRIFQIQIEYDEAKLLSERNTTFKKIRKHIINKYFFNLFFTIFSTMILCLGLFKFMNPLVAKAMTAPTRPINYLEHYNILYALLAFWIIGSWYISSYLFNHISRSKINVKQSKVDILLNIGLFLGFVFVAFFLPSYHQLFNKFAISSNESATVYVILKLFFSTEALGILILPALIYVSVLTFLKLKEKS